MRTRGGAAPGSGDDVGAAIAVDVAGGDVDAVDAGIRSEVGEDADVDAAERQHLSAERARRGDDVDAAIAVDVAGGDVARRRERAGRREIRRRASAAPTPLRTRTAPPIAGARDDVGAAVTRDVAGRHRDAAGVERR